MPKKIQKEKSDDFILPYESLVGKVVTKPILNPETEQQIQAAVANYTGKIRWEKWGMNALQKRGSLVLLTGPSGTGKTTISRYLAKKVGTGFIPISMADIGSDIPGQMNRNFDMIMAKAKKEGNTTIHIDECDGILWSRENVGKDSMFYLAVINSVLVGLDNYNGLVTMATNMPHLLDKALLSRVTDQIIVDVPSRKTREILWKEKIPSQYPYQPKKQELENLSRWMLTGREIEQVIIAEAKLAILQGRHPKFDSLFRIAEKVSYGTSTNKQRKA